MSSTQQKQLFLSVLWTLSLHSRKTGAQSLLHDFSQLLKAGDYFLALLLSSSSQCFHYISAGWDRVHYILGIWGRFSCSKNLMNSGTFLNLSGKATYPPYFAHFISYDPRFLPQTLSCLDLQANSSSFLKKISIYWSYFYCLVWS